MTNSRYNPNFTKGRSGNILSYGRDLVILVDGASVVTGKLSKRTRFGRWKTIQIEQSGHKGNPSIDTITFEMRRYNHNGSLSAMEPGKYKVKVWSYIPNTSSYGNTWSDKFEIV